MRLTSGTSQEPGFRPEKVGPFPESLAGQTAGIRFFVCFYLAVEGKEEPLSGAIMLSFRRQQPSQFSFQQLGLSGFGVFHPLEVFESEQGLDRAHRSILHSGCAHDQRRGGCADKRAQDWNGRVAPLRIAFAGDGQKGVSEARAQIPGGVDGIAGRRPEAEADAQTRQPTK